MTTKKSDLARDLDEIQASLRAFLKPDGFRVRGRTFNRAIGEGLTQVVNIQTSRFDPAKFTINIGVYVPDVARWIYGREAAAFVSESACCARSRLGALDGQNKDLWWNVQRERALIDELSTRIKRDAYAFFGRLISRDAILRELSSGGNFMNYGIASPRIVCAVILAERGEKNAARALLAGQAKETKNSGHPAYVRNLAERLGLGSLVD